MDKFSFEKIKQISEDTNIDIHKLLGNYYLKANDFANSMKNFAIYLMTYPNDAVVLGIVGFLYSSFYAQTMDNSYLEKAIIYTENAHSIDKNNNQITSNLATMYNDSGMTDKAFELLPEIIKNEPNDKNYYAYATVNLKKGNFAEYYKYADCRLRLKVANHFYPIFNKPQWRGEDISNSILLVHWEAGFGDTIMYSRYLRGLSKRAKKVVFVVQKELEELYRYNDFDCEICSDISQVGDFDYHVPLGSLMQIAGVSVGNLIYTDKYLNIDTEIIEKIKNLYFKGDKYRVAIKYCGDKSGPVNRNISHAMMEQLVKELKKLDNVEIYSFQFDDDIDGVINLKDMTSNFWETAAIIENMDLVVSSDNVILHLAGALGKKTFGMFNFASENRWFDLTGDDTKWYKSVKPYVTPKLNDWGSVITLVQQDVQGLKLKSNQ